MKKVTPLFVALVLLTAVFFLPLSLHDILPAQALAQNFTVDDDGPADFRSIQPAVNQAQTGDTVKVNPGTYNECVMIDKPLTLTGINYPVIDAQGQVSSIIIKAPSCVVDGFKLTNANGAGILIQSSGGNNTIRNNMAYKNSVYGMYIMNTSGNSVVNNTFFSNNNGVGFWIESNDYIANNTVFSNEVYGIMISSSSQMVVERNNIYAQPSESGLSLQGCNNSNFTNNVIAGNIYGITIESSGQGNIITSNYVANNNWGIRLWSPIRDNYFFHNDIVNNTVQAARYDVPTQIAQNVWDDGYPSGGNYWSNYNGADVDNDGIGDSPYVIDSYNIDHYPLIEPYTLISIASFSISPSSGSGGANVRFIVSGLPSSTTIRIWYFDPNGNWINWLSTTSDARGKINCTLEMPDLATLSAKDDNPESHTQLTFRVEQQGIIYGYWSYIEYARGLKKVGNQTANGLFGQLTSFSSKVKVNSGDTLTLSGKWFHANDIIRIKFDGPTSAPLGGDWSRNEVIGESMSNNEGSFETTVVMPSAMSGSHYLALEDSQTRLIFLVSLIDPNWRYPSTTQVSCFPNPAIANSQISCSVTVSGRNPTGNVTWNTSSPSGRFSVTSTPLTSGASSVFYNDTSFGNVTITVTYSGDQNNAPSNGSATLNINSSSPVIPEYPHVGFFVLAAFLITLVASKASDFQHRNKCKHISTRFCVRDYSLLS